MFEHLGENIGFFSIILILLVFGVPFFFRAYYFTDTIRKMTQRRRNR